MNDSVKTVAPVAWSVYDGKGETVAVFIKQEDAEQYAKVAFANWEIRGTQALASIADMLRDFEAAHTRAERLAAENEALSKELGECSGGYQTMKEELVWWEEKAEKLTTQRMQADERGDDGWRRAHAAELRSERLEAALRELVALKNMKESIEPPNFEPDAVKRVRLMDEYRRRKSAAWASARSALDPK